MLRVSYTTALSPLDVQPANRVPQIEPAKVRQFKNKLTKMGCSTSQLDDDKVSEISKPTRRITSKLDLPVSDMRNFLAFCETKLAGENVRFYMAVQAYEALFDEAEVNREAIVQAGENIVVQFLSTKSPNEIYLPDEEKKKILTDYETCNWRRETFRSARIEVVSTLLDNIVPLYEGTRLLKRESSSASRSSTNRSSSRSILAVTSL